MSGSSLLQCQGVVPLGPPSRALLRRGLSGLLRVAGVSPPVDGGVDAQEGAGHHIPPLVNDRAVCVQLVGGRCLSVPLCALGAATVTL